ncbi:replication initiation factor domain-containing protein, partial [Chromobacterium alkanivorans]|uniref:replication initiation factor domain-containing protein n=1 Tax=Chromobacterium alkanivorans TaxID=1071719 RepID=UPI0019674037
MSEVYQEQGAPQVPPASPVPEELIHSSTPFPLTGGSNTLQGSKTPALEPVLEVFNNKTEYSARQCSSLHSDGFRMPLKLDFLTVTTDTLKPDHVGEQLILHGFHMKPRKPRFCYQFAYSVHCDEMMTDEPVFEVYYGGEHQKGTMMFDRSGPLAAVAVTVLCRVFGPEPFRLSRGDVAIDLQWPGGYADARAHLLLHHENWQANGQRGRKPKIREIIDHGQDTGCTFYMGSGDVHMCRLYEKGKQLSRADAMDWFRFEVQLRPDGKPAQILAWNAVASGRYFEIWRMTPYVRFSDFFLSVDAERVRPEQPARDCALEARAKHFVKQYYGMMRELVGVHAHGDWSELGNIVQRLKSALDAGQGSTWHVEQVLLDMEGEAAAEALKFSSADGSHN